MLFAVFFRQPVYMHFGHSEHIGRIDGYMRPVAPHLIIINEAKDVVLRLMDVKHQITDVFGIVAERFAQPYAEPLPQFGIEIDVCSHNDLFLLFRQ